MKKIIRMSGGLANRMFQYSYAIYLNSKGVPACVDNNYKPTKWKMEEIDWNRIFPKAILNQATDWDIFKCSGGYGYVDKIRRHYFKFTSSVFFSKSAFFLPTKEEIKHYNYFIGIYQNAQMINSITQKIQDFFMFNRFKDKKNINLKNSMQDENSVAIHVRKGKDYLQRECYKGTCDIDYYKKAVAYIKAHVSSPKFYVFTDNPSWVKDNFKYFDYTLVDHNPVIGFGNHFDMQLMSCCKHNIIANSTYSWWGAFLNKYENKICIGPRNWFYPYDKNHVVDVDMTLPSNWVAI